MYVAPVPQTAPKPLRSPFRVLFAVGAVGMTLGLAFMTYVDLAYFQSSYMFIYGAAVLPAAIGTYRGWQGRSLARKTMMVGATLFAMSLMTPFLTGNAVATIQFACIAVVIGAAAMGTDPASAAWKAQLEAGGGKPIGDLQRLMGFPIPRWYWWIAAPLGVLSTVASHGFDTSYLPRLSIQAAVSTFMTAGLLYGLQALVMRAVRLVRKAPAASKPAVSAPQ